MKTIILCFVPALFISPIANGQVPGSRNLHPGAEQLAELIVYKGSLEKGYQITSYGLGGLMDTATAVFQLIGAHDHSLQAIDSGIRQLALVHQLWVVQSTLLKWCPACREYDLSSPNVHPEERTYYTAVYSAMIRAALNSMDRFQRVMTAGAYSMDDGERLRQLSDIFRQEREQSAFMQYFNGEIALLAAERNRAGNQVRDLRRLYALPE